MSVELGYTPLAQIPEIHSRLLSTFKSGITRPLAYRRKQLLQLARLVQENVTAIEDAELHDLGKPRQEVVMVELGTIVQACLYAAERLEEWNKPEKPTVEEWRSSWDTTVYKEPKGVALIISPWNYPIVLALDPLVGAIAAGCPVVLKPSEITPACSSVLINLVQKYLDPAAYVVVNGSVNETTALLNLRWDHIFFTGGTKIGKIVAAAAAKFVTPLTLELGGKSPVIVDPICDIELAAKRVLFGKIQNAGQLCVSPDYVLVPKSVAKEFKEALKKAYEQFWPSGNPLDTEYKWGKIVSVTHYKRITALLERTKGRVILGGRTEGDRRIAPTVIEGVGIDDSLMEEENFGPVLPILEVENVDEAIRLVGSRPTPLVIYLFTDSEDTKQKVFEGTRSGTICMNDTISQLSVYEMPFGGQGDSGYGAYLGKGTFDVFTHRRSFIHVPKEIEPHLAFRYPPYTADSYKVVLGSVNVKIPDA